MKDGRDDMEAPKRTRDRGAREREIGYRAGLADGMALNLGAREIMARAEAEIDALKAAALMQGLASLQAQTLPRRTRGVGGKVVRVPPKAELPAVIGS